MKTIVLGNIAKAPVMKTNKNGKKYVSMSVCEDMFKKENEEFKRIGNVFYNVTSYLPSVIDQAMLLGKGDRVEISGQHSEMKNGKTTVHFLQMTNAKLVMKAKAKALNAVQAEVPATEAPVIEEPKAEAPKKRGRKKAEKKAA